MVSITQLLLAIGITSQTVNSSPIVYTARDTSVNTVKVDFEVYALAGTGERIGVVGNTTILGNGSPEHALKLYNGSPVPQWHALVDLPAGITIGYNFVGITANGSVIVEEGPERVYTVPESSYGFVMGTVRGQSSFALERRELSTRSEVEQAPTPTKVARQEPSTTSLACMATVTVNFMVYAAPGNGGSVKVVGSTPELGEWNVEKAPIMYTGGRGAPQWTRIVPMAGGTSLEYKFVEIKSNGTEVLEFGPNRVFQAPCDFFWGQIVTSFLE